jgi:hypothetical protein
MFLGSHCSSPYFFFGTFAPFLRAFESPIAMACFRLFTLCLPERMWRISVRTSELAFLLYLRRLDFFFAGILSPFFIETPAGGCRVAFRSVEAPGKSSESF